MAAGVGQASSELIASSQKALKGLNQAPEEHESCCHFLGIQDSGEKAHLLHGFSGPTPEVEAGDHHGSKGSWELGV